MKPRGELPKQIVAMQPGEEIFVSEYRHSPDTVRGVVARVKRNASHWCGGPRSYQTRRVDFGQIIQRTA